MSTHNQSNKREGGQAGARNQAPYDYFRSMEGTETNFRPDPNAVNSKSSKESAYNKTLELEKLIREREQVPKC